MARATPAVQHAPIEWVNVSNPHYTSRNIRRRAVIPSKGVEAGGVSKSNVLQLFEPPQFARSGTRCSATTKPEPLGMKSARAIVGLCPASSLGIPIRVASHQSRSRISRTPAPASRLRRCLGSTERSVIVDGAIFVASERGRSSKCSIYQAHHISILVRTLGNVATLVAFLYYTTTCRRRSRSLWPRGAPLGWEGISYPEHPCVLLATICSAHSVPRGT